MLSRATMHANIVLQSAQNAGPTSYVKDFAFQGPGHPNCWSNLPPPYTMAKPIARQINTIIGPLRRNFFIITIVGLQVDCLWPFLVLALLDKASLYTLAKLLPCWGILAFFFARRLSLRACLVCPASWFCSESCSSTT